MNIIQRFFYKLFPEKSKWNKFKDKLPEKGDYIILESVYFDNNGKEYPGGYIDEKWFHLYRVNIVEINKNIDSLHATIELSTWMNEYKNNKPIKRCLMIWMTDFAKSRYTDSSELHWMKIPNL